MTSKIHCEIEIQKNNKIIRECRTEIDRFDFKCFDLSGQPVPIELEGDQQLADMMGGMSFGNKN